MALITLNLESGFLKTIDQQVKQAHYHNRTEFIREALREKIESQKRKEAIMKLYGSMKGKAKRTDYEKIRQEAFEEIEKGFKPATDI